MNSVYKAFIRFFSSRRNVFLFGLLIAIIATALEVCRGRNTNYFDYQDSTRMFWEGITPYTYEYRDAHAIYFLYFPVFNVVFAPIFFLPWWLGPFVWNIGNYSLFSLAIKSLPEQFEKYKNYMFLFLLPVLLQAIFCYQHNTIVAYIFIFAFILLERGKNFWAVFLIMFSACTKVYGAAELALLLCYPKMWKNFGYAAVLGVFFLCLPLLNPHFDNPFVLYQQMFDMLGDHHGSTDYVGILFARGLKPFLLQEYRLVQVAVLGLLAVGFFACYKRWGDFRFRVQSLAVLSGYMILFSDCPETHTYLIALGPWIMAFVLQDERKWYDWALLSSLVFNFGIIPTDVLCPRAVHEWIHETLWLDVYTFFLAWLRVLWLAVGPKKKVHLAPKIVTALMLVCLPVGTRAQSAFSCQKRGSDLVCSVKGVEFTMKFVQGGEFMMGNPSPQDLTSEDEFPAHKVHVSNMYVGQTEVTQSLWEAIMPKNPSKIKGKNMPVEYVMYEDVMDFITELNKVSGLKFRLPTEAEWEYAARGGRKSHGYLYAGSDNAFDVAFMAYNSHDTHFPVAMKQPNELGLYDMSGNVWEFCSDFYGKYGSEKRSRNFHVIRGGAYDSTPSLCRTTNRYMYDLRRRRSLLGFRLVLSHCH